MCLFLSDLFIFPDDNLLTTERIALTVLPVLRHILFFDLLGRGGGYDYDDPPPPYNVLFAF